jgi:hypothetical protein
VHVGRIGLSDHTFTSRNTVLLEKVTVIWLVKKCFAFYGPGGSLPCSQEHATRSYLEPDEIRLLSYII